MRPVLRLPFTLAFLAAMVTANWLAGTLSGLLPPQALTDWGISHQSILNGEVFRLVTGTFLSHDLGMFLRQFCFAAGVIGAYEWLEGTGRAFAVFVSIDILGSLIVLFAVLPSLAGLPHVAGEAALLTHDVGMSAGGFGLIGALIARQGQSWLFLALILAAIALKIWVSFDVIADSAHILCLLLGFGLAFLLGKFRPDGNLANP
jgi:hypothetical protein